MKLIFKLTVMLALLLLPVTPLWAHGGEETEVDAPTLARQAIAFLDGIKDSEAAESRLQEALEMDDSSLDAKKLQEAQQALKSKDVEKAKIALIYALGSDPETAPELALHPKFAGGGAGYSIIIISILFILSGLAILRSGKSNRKVGINHEKMA